MKREGRDLTHTQECSHKVGALVRGGRTDDGGYISSMFSADDGVLIFIAYTAVVGKASVSQ